MYKSKFVAVIFFFSLASSSFVELDPRQKEGSSTVACENVTAMKQACYIEIDEKKCRAVFCTPKCQRVIPVFKECCKYSDILQFLGCINHAESTTQTARPITIASSCQDFGYSYASCYFKTPGFSTLEPSQQASCLCYRSDGAWDPAAFDSALSSCYVWGQRFFKTAPPAVKSYLTSNSYFVSAVTGESGALKSYSSLVSSFTAHHPGLSVNNLSICIIYGNVRGATKTVMPITGDMTPTAPPVVPGMGTIKHTTPRQTPKPTFASIHGGPMTSKAVAAMATALPRKDVEIVGALFAGLMAFF